jgi:group I intron endonuclease
MVNSPCVYILKPSFSNKSYIGSTINFDRRFNQHLTSLNKGNHHNVSFQNEWNENTIQEMVVSIIRFDTIEAARAMEDKLIKQLISSGCLFNISNDATGGDSRTYHPDKDKITAKMVATNVVRLAKLSQEDKNRIWGRRGERNGMYGKTHTPEARLIISKANKGRISAYRGIPIKDDVKKILSEKAKLKVGKLNAFYGRHHTEEYKQHASTLRKGVHTFSCARPISVGGIEYPSLAVASKALNIPLTTVRHRAISENKKYNNYFYVR